MSKVWSPEEIKFIKKRIVEDGIHPDVVSKEHYEKFKIHRSYQSIRHKLRDLGIRYGEYLKYPDPDIPEQPEDIAESVKHERRIQSLRQENAVLRNKYNEALDQINLHKTVASISKEVIKCLPVVPLPKLPPVSGKLTPEHAVLHLSDIHWGEIVSSNEMRGYNVYNTEIANTRLKVLTEGIIDIVKNKLRGYDLRCLHIFMLGDMISGDIHEELVEGVIGDVIIWSVDCAFVLAQMVQELSMVFPKIEIVGVVGNHGRFFKKPRFKKKYLNWDWMTYQLLSSFLYEHIKQKRVKIEIPMSFWEVTEVLGHNWLLLHGDNIKSWMSIPWYGIGRTMHNLKELLETKQEHFEYLSLGHFHNQGTLDAMRGEIIINGSVIGGTEYSFGKLYTTSQPRQWFIGVHKNQLSWRFPMDLQGKAPVGDLYKTADISKAPLGSLISEIGELPKDNLTIGRY